MLELTVDNKIMSLLQIFHNMSSSYFEMLLMHSVKPTQIETVN
jgi:hypothetical protein